MRFSQIIESYGQLDEVAMSPSKLRQLAASIDATAGMEFEMIVPNISVDEYPDQEPDYDQDERSRSWSDIEDFFEGGEGVNSSREVSRALQDMQEEFFEWADEQVHEEFYNDRRQLVTDWVINNVSDEDILDYGNYEDDDRERFETDREFRNQVIKDYVDNAIENGTSDYDSAQEAYVDDYRGDVSEEDWLRRNYPYMSDVQNNFDLSWPYYTSISDSNADIQPVADDFEKAIGREVIASDSYHGPRRAGAYTIEPDSSLEGDDGAGLEFVSPPLPLADMLSDLTKVKEWASKYGATTNNSTGLHMNVSVPGMDSERLDYVKLALLLGDEYVLNQFGRSANGYAKSAMSIVRDRVSQRPEDAAVMLEKMKDKLDQFASKLIHSGATSKYTSINVKDNYIEFRSPGGNWLAEDLGKLENTLLRFVVAMDAALDPAKYREEYLKKLYKILAPQGNERDTLSYFARFAAGEMPKAALKSFVKQAQLERNAKKGAAQPAPDAAKPADVSGSIQYELFNRSTDQVYRKFWSRDDEMAIELGNGYKQEIRAESPDASIGLRRVPGQNPDSGGYAAAPSTGGEFTGTWLVKDAQGRTIHRISGIGNVQADANRHAMNWLRQNPAQMQQGVEVVPEMR